MVKFDFREEWKPSFVVADETYICYNCNTTVCAKFKIKYEYNDGRQRILFCPSCNAPSVFDYQNEQIIKNVDYGNFNKVPENILNLYREICDCISVSANRGAFLLLRTLLAYIAIELDKDKQTGLKEGGNFTEYIKYLEDNSFFLPNLKTHIEKIRKHGGDIAHKPSFQPDREDIDSLMKIIEFLLHNNYEFI